MSTDVPPITDSRNGTDPDSRKRGKRYDPYGSPGKRGRKAKRSNSTLADHQPPSESHPKPTLTVSVSHSAGSPQQSPQRFQSPTTFPPSHIQSPQLPTSFASSSPGYHQDAPSTVMSPAQYPSMGIPAQYPVMHGYHHVATYSGPHPYPPIGPPQSTAGSPVAATQTPPTPAPTQSQLSYPHYPPDPSQPPVYYYSHWNGYGGWNYPTGYQNGSGQTPSTSPMDGITNGVSQPPSGGNSEEGTIPT